MPVSHPPPNGFLVERKKVQSYLLNLDHPDGRSKANFFIRWGFGPALPERLTAALLGHPRLAALTAASSSSWGLRFIYEGPLIAPRGSTPPVGTVWEVKTGDDVARLVTAYRI